MFLCNSTKLETVNEDVWKPIEVLYTIARAIDGLLQDFDRASVQARKVTKFTVYMVHSVSIDPVSSQVMKSDAQSMLQQWIDQKVINDPMVYGTELQNALEKGISESTEAQKGANHRLDAASALVAFLILHSSDITPSDRIATSEPLSHPSYRFLQAANRIVFQKHPFILPTCTGNVPAGPWFLADVGTYTHEIRESLVCQVLQDLRSRVLSSITRGLRTRRLEQHRQYVT